MTGARWLDLSEQDRCARLQLAAHMTPRLERVLRWSVLALALQALALVAAALAAHTSPQVYGVTVSGVVFELSALDNGRVGR